MIIKRVTQLFAALFAAAGITAASAAPLQGAVSSVGTICLGVTAASPVGSSCSVQDVSTLTYLDFIVGGAPPPLTATPGVAGELLFLAALEDLMPLHGRTGIINDFSLPGPGDPLSGFTAINPLWTATGTDGATYTYALETLTNIIRSVPNALDVRGTGTLCRDGTDCNLFSFLFTTQNAQGQIRTTFSVSQSGFRVPEPGSLALLGLGLAALGWRARRRD